MKRHKRSFTHPCGLKPKQVIEITITHLGGLGDGIADYQGTPVYIPYTTTGDTVRASITHISREAIQAEMLDVRKPGKDRVEAPCPHFSECGGCQLQHLNQESYTSFKEDRLRRALRQAGLDTALMEPLHSVGAGVRRRVTFKAKTGHDGIPRLGFFKQNSHTLISLSACPVIHPALFAARAHLETLLVKTPVLHTVQEVSLSYGESGVDAVLVLKEEPDLNTLETLADFANKEDMARISVKVKNTWFPVVERRPVVMQVGNVAIPLPPGCFQQAAASAQEIITHRVTSALNDARNVLDLFSGCGGYSAALAQSNPQCNIHAAEGSTAMVAALTRAAQKHQLGHRITASQRDLEEEPFTPKELSAYDAVILNPPRTGALAQIRQIAESSIALVVMVSCNPATLARDAKILAESGFTLTSALPIDQFHWSGHLEQVLVLKR